MSDPTVGAHGSDPSSSQEPGVPACGVRWQGIEAAEEREGLGREQPEQGSGPFLGPEATDCRTV